MLISLACEVHIRSFVLTHHGALLNFYFIMMGKRSWIIEWRNKSIFAEMTSILLPFNKEHSFICTQVALQHPQSNPKKCWGATRRNSIQTEVRSPELMFLIWTNCLCAFWARSCQSDAYIWKINKSWLREQNVQQGCTSYSRSSFQDRGQRTG